MSTHRCPAPGCTEDVEGTMFACRVDWRRLPPAIRAAIWRTYRARVAAAGSGASAEALRIVREAHLRAMSSGLAWYGRNPR